MSGGIKGLIAAGPRTDCADRMRLFGQFVGDWVLDAVFHDRSGSVTPARGTWNFGWILDGSAVQDVWRVVPADAPKGAAPIGYGTTVRMYDPRVDFWRITWSGVTDGFVALFAAHPEGDRIVLQGANRESAPMRWVFSEIAPDSFRWQCLVAEWDHWRMPLEMWARRVS